MVLDSAALKDRLDPKHLSTEDMKEQVEEESKKVPQTPTKEESSSKTKTEREHTFDFKWTDGNGKVWSGKFTNQVPDLKTRSMIGAFRAQMGLNLPSESLDQVTQEINLVISHLSFSLIDRPKWAQDLGSLYDFRLLQALYEEVASHEAKFLGYSQITESSGE